jgi:hypothetical protein
MTVLPLHPERRGPAPGGTMRDAARLADLDRRCAELLADVEVIAAEAAAVREALGSGDVQSVGATSSMTSCLSTPSARFAPGTVGERRAAERPVDVARRRRTERQCEAALAQPLGAAAVDGAEAPDLATGRAARSRRMQPSEERRLDAPPWKAGGAPAYRGRIVASRPACPQGPCQMGSDQRCRRATGRSWWPWTRPGCRGRRSVRRTSRSTARLGSAGSSRTTWMSGARR